MVQKADEEEEDTGKTTPSSLVKYLASLSCTSNKITSHFIISKKYTRKFVRYTFIDRVQSAMSNLLPLYYNNLLLINMALPPCSLTDSARICLIRLEFYYSLATQVFHRDLLTS